jgi:hypothetical protein
MTFQQLQENLRTILWQRIDAGELTGLQLAHQTGFQQAHISNFLNRRRGLSLEGMDNVLACQKLSILDLVDPSEINKRASIPPPSLEGFDNVQLVDKETAIADPLVTREKQRGTLSFKRSFLRRLKPDMATPRQTWTRFVMVRIGQEAMSMYPRIAPGANVLIDRHYNSLRPYRKGEPNMYAVRKENECVVNFVELAGSNLILRPYNQAFPVDIIPIPEGASCADHIIGRVCYVGIET